jgi:hypothetical protein
LHNELTNDVFDLWRQAAGLLVVVVIAEEGDFDSGSLRMNKTETAFALGRAEVAALVDRLFTFLNVVGVVFDKLHTVAVLLERYLH